MSDTLQQVFVGSVTLGVLALTVRTARLYDTRSASSRGRRWAVNALRYLFPPLGMAAAPALGFAALSSAQPTFGMAAAGVAFASAAIAALLLDDARQSRPRPSPRDAGD